MINDESNWAMGGGFTFPDDIPNSFSGSVVSDATSPEISCPDPVALNIGLGNLYR